MKKKPKKKKVSNKIKRFMFCPSCEGWTHGSTSPDYLLKSFGGKGSDELLPLTIKTEIKLICEFCRFEWWRSIY